MHHSVLIQDVNSSQLSSEGFDCLITDRSLCFPFQDLFVELISCYQPSSKELKCPMIERSLFFVSRDLFIGFTSCYLYHRLFEKSSKVSSEWLAIPRGGRMQPTYLLLFSLRLVKSTISVPLLPHRVECLCDLPVEFELDSLVVIYWS